jgi:hypothetical protein
LPLVTTHTTLGDTTTQQPTTLSSLSLSLRLHIKNFALGPPTISGKEPLDWLAVDDYPLSNISSERESESGWPSPPHQEHVQAKRPNRPLSSTRSKEKKKKAPVRAPTASSAATPARPSQSQRVKQPQLLPAIALLSRHPTTFSRLRAHPKRGLRSIFARSLYCPPLRRRIGILDAHACGLAIDTHDNGNRILPSATASGTDGRRRRRISQWSSSRTNTSAWPWP